MTYICLDTCTWIYLVNGTEPVRILKRIDEEVNKGSVTLLVPRIIIDEFERNLTKAVHSGVNRYLLDIEKNINALTSLLGDDSAIKYSEFLLDENIPVDNLKIFKSSFREIKSLTKNGVDRNITLAKNLFANENVVILEMENVKDQVVEFGLKKKAPFNGKNGTADAIIIFSFLEYVQSNNIHDAKFISGNLSDFCGEDKKTLHQDLQILFEDVKATFYTKAAEAINSIIPEFVEPADLEYIDRLTKMKNPDYVCSDCLIFKGKKSFCHVFEVNFDDNRETANIYSQKVIETKICDDCETFYLLCPSCKEWIYKFDLEAPEELECENCNLKFELSYDYDSDEISYITLEENLLECEKCGSFYKDDGNGLNICEDCEANYAYGE